MSAGKTKILVLFLEKERVNSAKPSERGGRGGRREPREIRENDGERRPHRRQGPREYRDNRGGDENVPPEFRLQFLQIIYLL